ncbi:MAG: family intrarane metalloprotease [Rhodoglobus sp.]|nr:family intrarane metalloprotease [Rhodoglobus sp.]
MLDPSWALTRPLLWLTLAALLAVLVLRAIHRDRREYRRFKSFRLTAERQRMFRKWLLESFLQFGGLSAALLILAGFAVAPLLQELTGWPGVRELRGLLIHEPEVAWGVLFGVMIALVVLTVIGARSARKEQEVPMIGDISAMLPRNRQELVLGAILSVNAGVVEELMFRLALPAVIYGASGSALAAVLGSVLLFGALHVYQGIPGVVGTTIVGAILMLLYAVSGTIVVPIIVHVLFDLRSLVLIPVAVYGVHKLDGAAVASPLPTPADPVPTEPPLV